MRYLGTREAMNRMLYEDITRRGGLRLSEPVEVAPGVWQVRELSTPPSAPRRPQRPASRGGHPVPRPALASRHAPVRRAGRVPRWAWWALAALLGALAVASVVFVIARYWPVIVGALALAGALWLAYMYADGNKCSGIHVRH